MSSEIKLPSDIPVVFFSKQFEKDWKYLGHEKTKEKFIQILPIFLQNPFRKEFSNHELKGDFKGIRSINITGDVRAFYYTENEIFIFLRVGTHSHLYG